MTGSGQASPATGEEFLPLPLVIAFTEKKKKEKKKNPGFFPKGFTVSQNFSHLWRKKQFSGISREPSRLEQQETEEGSKVPAGRGGSFRTWMRIEGNVQP